jgi:hypothetical protein
VGNPTRDAKDLVSAWRLDQTAAVLRLSASRILTARRYCPLARNVSCIAASAQVNLPKKAPLIEGQGLSADALESDAGPSGCAVSSKSVGRVKRATPPGGLIGTRTRPRLHVHNEGVLLAQTPVHVHLVSERDGPAAAGIRDRQKVQRAVNSSSRKPGRDCRNVQVAGDSGASCQKVPKKNRAMPGVSFNIWELAFPGRGSRPSATSDLVVARSAATADVLASRVDTGKACRLSSVTSGAACRGTAVVGAPVERRAYAVSQLALKVHPRRTGHIHL